MKKNWWRFANTFFLSHRKFKCSLTCTPALSAWQLITSCFPDYSTAVQIGISIFELRFFIIKLNYYILHTLPLLRVARLGLCGILFCHYVKGLISNKSIRLFFLDYISQSKKDQKGLLYIRVKTKWHQPNVWQSVWATWSMKILTLSLHH